MLEEPALPAVTIFPSGWTTNASMESLAAGEFRDRYTRGSEACIQDAIRGSNLDGRCDCKSESKRYPSKTNLSGITGHGECASII